MHHSLHSPSNHAVVAPETLPGIHENHSSDHSHVAGFQKRAFPFLRNRSLQLCMLWEDVFNLFLYVPYPLFPLPGVACFGVLCKVGVSAHAAWVSRELSPIQFQRTEPHLRVVPRVPDSDDRKRRRARRRLPAAAEHSARRAHVRELPTPTQAMVEDVTRKQNREYSRPRQFTLVFTGCCCVWLANVPLTAFLGKNHSRKREIILVSMKNRRNLDQFLPVLSEPPYFRLNRSRPSHLGHRPY